MSLSNARRADGGLEAGSDKELRDSGIKVIGSVPWGTHFCQFYEDGRDLVDILVPYFKAGLLENEFCMWITSEPLEVDAAKAALRRAVPNLDSYLKRGQIEILDYKDWYLRSGRFDSDEVLQAWVSKLTAALGEGFDGLRLTGNTHWLESSQWRDFTEYEEQVNGVIGQHRMIALCTYSLRKCGAMEIMDVIANHRFALIRRNDRWELVESSQNKLTEAALRESEERFSKAFHLSPAPMTISRFDDGTWVDVNESFERLTGYSREVLVGQNSVGLNMVLDLAERDEIIEALRTKGSISNREITAYTRRGERIRLLFTSVVVSLSGTPHVVTTHTDITEREKAMEALKRSNAELEQFAYAASHDLQEPLRMIINNLSLLERHSHGKLDHRDELYLTAAVESGRRMRELIDDLLAYSRIDKQAKPFTDVDMTAVMRSTVEVFQGRIDELGAKVSWREMPTIVADEPLMRKLMENLVGNALKFHGPEKPEVTITTEERPYDYLFRVQDNGIGIGKEDQARIFEMFTRLHGEGEYPGTGIGLAIAKKIVDRHGGAIWVESEEGKGATFLFTIPRDIGRGPGHPG